MAERFNTKFYTYFEN